MNNYIDDQVLSEKATDKEGIKKDKEVADLDYIDTSYIPKENIVLRSGARWIEKGTVYDPSMRQNRKLTKAEYDELIRKGLTKKDFAGWHLT